MKKSLFYSVAIAAALASCTQEAIEVVDNNVQQDLSVRPTLGEIVLVENTEVMSRFAVGNGAQPVFSEGDKLGAAIMDMPLYPNVPYNVDEPSVNYQIVNYYSSNSAFTYDGSAWYLNEDQPLVEGNYMFYAPYNAAMQFRSAFEVAVPEKQAASTEKAALDEFYASGSVVRVGYQFLAAESGVAQKPKVTMNDVFAYPKFTIKNNFSGIKRSLGGTATEWTGDLKVDSVQLVLAATNEGVALKGKLSNQGAADVMSSQWAETPFENYTAQLLDDDATMAKNGEVITTLVAGGREIKKGESAVFYAVMPAAQYAADVLAAKIYVTIDGKPYVFNKGNWTKTVSTINGATVTSYTWDENVENITYKTTTGPVTLIKGQRYPQEELNFEDGKLSSKMIAGNALTLDLKGGFIGGTVTNVEYLQEVAVTVAPVGPTVTDLIDNNEELIAFFKELENGSALKEGEKIDYAKAEYAFSENNTVEINAELIEALSKYNNKGTASLASVFPIANDVTVACKSDEVVTFTTGNGVSYSITLGNGYEITDESVIAGNKSVHVITNWNATSNVLGNVVIYKSASVTVDTEVMLEATSFINNGRLTVRGNVVNPVTNNGTIKVEAPKNLVINDGIGEIIAEADDHTTEEALASLNNVSVTGGTQTGYYVVSSVTADAVADAETIAWVGNLKYDGALAFSQEILDEVKDITTFHITGASFPKGTFDMTGLTLYMEGADAMTISGVHKSQTIVNNVTIYNATGEQISLATIAANGSYSKVENGGELYANGTTAAWNGASVGVDAEKYLENALYEGLTEIVLPSNISMDKPLALTNGATLNGNGKTLKSSVQQMISINNGKVEGIVIDGEGELAGSVSKRAIYNHNNKTTGTLEIDNVTIKGVGYALNLYGESGSSFVVKNSTLVGWTSFTGYASSTFENCHFGNGSYFSGMPSNGNLKPHNNVVLTNCTFEKGFCLDFEKNPTITMKNCKVAGVVITAENIRSLLGSANENDELTKVAFIH